MVLGRSARIAAAVFAAAVFAAQGLPAQEEQAPEAGAEDGAFSSFPSEAADDATSDYPENSFGGPFPSFDDSFGDSSFGGGFGSNPFSFSLEAGIAARAMLGGDSWRGYFDADDLRDLVFIDPSAKLTLAYSSGKADFSLSIRADSDTLQLYPADILEEFTARAYIGDFVLEAGKMKVVWGKGDEVHVVDLFNANDYTDFIYPSYIDRRLAEPMVRLAWNGVNLRAEAIYTPMMTADRYATTGPWTPGLLTDVTSAVESALMGDLIGALGGIIGGSGNITDLIAAVEAISSASDIIPSTNSFDYGQLGARLTGTVGPVDWGVSYYLGHFKQPSINWTSLNVQYDRLQSFGVEAAAALGRFNLRGEFAYYLTDDFKGTNPSVRNNSLNWVAGFDVDLPLHNINVNVQNYGSWIINSGGIKSAADTEYNSTGRYSNNKIALQVSDTFLRERLSLALKAVFGIERLDFILIPEVSFAFTPELKFTLSGMYITGSDSGEFAYWHDNSFIELGVKYVF